MDVVDISFTIGELVVSFISGQSCALYEISDDGLGCQNGQLLRLFPNHPCHLLHHQKNVAINALSAANVTEDTDGEDTWGFKMDS